MQEELMCFQQSGVLAGEKKCLESFVSSLRGYHLLLLGSHRKLNDLPPHCLHGVGLSPSYPVEENSIAWLQSSFENLALRDNSIDAVIVPYILEYVANPDAVLKELHRILIGQGKLCLFGFERFHPWCWLNAPKSKHNISLRQMKKLLNHSDFAIEEIRHFYYGAIYFITAQKHISPLTPLRLQWKKVDELKGLFARADTRNFRDSHAKPRH